MLTPVSLISMVCTDVAELNGNSDNPMTTGNHKPVTSSPLPPSSAGANDDDVRVTSPADDNNTTTRKARKKLSSRCRKSEEIDTEIAAQPADKGVYLLLVRQQSYICSRAGSTGGRPGTS